MSDVHPPLMESGASCGFPSPAEQYTHTPLDLNELLVKNPEATFFVRAEGESMINAGIRNGDILVVDRSIIPVENSIIIACVNNEFTVKYLHRNEDGVILKSGNPEYPDIVLFDGSELRVFGVVTGCIHQF
jgi:DNA polymerase V